MLSPGGHFKSSVYVNCENNRLNIDGKQSKHSTMSLTGGPSFPVSPLTPGAPFIPYKEDKDRAWMDGWTHACMYALSIKCCTVQSGIRVYPRAPRSRRSDSSKEPRLSLERWMKTMLTHTHRLSVNNSKLQVIFDRDCRVFTSSRTETDWVTITEQQGNSPLISWLRWWDIY